MVAMMDASKHLLERDIVSLDVRLRDRPGRLIKFTSMLA
jgi:ACT domain-containing protein